MLLPMLRNRFWAPTQSDSFFTLRREIDRLFDRFWTGDVLSENTLWVPPMDVVERDGEIRCSLELPGLKVEDVNITVENGVLTISGERQYEREEDQGGSQFVERRYGRFERSFTLPEYVDADHITADYDNGVLTVVLPKTAAAKARRIEIRGGSEPKQIESGKSDRHAA